jgi:flagellar basal-body rod protein FlgB
MDPTQTGPLALAERRLHWLDARQRVLAQNIANADTPGFRGSDLRPFGETLARAAGGTPTLATTNARHIAGGGGVPGAERERRVAERTPDGNSVSIEEQAMKVAETDQAHALAITLHRRFMNMFRTALGRQG